MKVINKWEKIMKQYDVRNVYRDRSGRIRHKFVRKVEHE